MSAPHAKGGCWFCTSLQRREGEHRLGQGPSGIGFYTVAGEAAAWCEAADSQRDELTSWVASFCSDHQVEWSAALLKLEDAS